MSELRLRNNNRCLGCGTDNPCGLKMKIERRGDEWVSEMTVPHDFQGWANVAHGGFLCTVMDEVMAWAMRGFGCIAVTARLRARFLKPVMTGSAIVVRGRATKRRGKVAHGEARVELKDGSVAADATGVFILTDGGVSA
jgi:acyl-coenzyme A thioesterase PaaI-like protein